MTIDYYRELLIKTRYVDPRIKETYLYALCLDEYVNQKYGNYECSVSAPDLVMFKSNSVANAGLGIKHGVLSKNIIQMHDNYCLTYSESRQFNTKHNLVNLDINIEFLLGEKIKINAFKASYGVVLRALHFKVSEIDNSYVLYAHIPTVSVQNFYMIPFGEIFAGCYPETIQMFEDYYSGNLYTKKVLKK